MPARVAPGYNYRMARLERVDIAPLDPRRFDSVLDDEQFAAFAAAIERSRSILRDRVVWNVNSTARGGGVAEMLRSLIAYAQGAGADARWVVIGGNPDFFAITKRIHNNLHGADGDGGDLGEPEQETYTQTLAANAEELMSAISEGDVVILHDPQTAGLAETVRATGACVIWRCHVGLDMPNDLARRAWRFLIPHIDKAHGYVFSRKAFAWEGLDAGRITVIPPSIDAFSPKNQEMERETVHAILRTAGLDGEGDAEPAFQRVDGKRELVTRRAELFETGAPPPDAKLVVQVSRWDRLKDPVGVIQGFAQHVANMDGAHLVVAGPAVEAVSDDPEGAEVLAESRRAWRDLDAAQRASVHLACLPMDDGDENAAIVNALQRRADVVVQKSLAEGFGLTVAEAMWKGRPVVASRIGGIQDQIVDGTTGLLIDDAHDLDSYGTMVASLLADADRAGAMGREAQRRVKDEFLGPRHLMRYLDLIEKLCG
jgi:trehalose synthase